MFEISTVRQLLHEFAICVSLSFTIVLAVIHTLLQLPLSLSYLAPTQLQIHWLSPTLLRITESHACPLTVLKATVACTVLVFAGREIIFSLGKLLGICRTEEEEDLESGNSKRPSPLATEPSWGLDEKNSRILPEFQ
ncbi:hypothetical protein C8J57DRAFT_1234633 [Mycena rebaudengoi]|nr:hypothetical protein C8J57DRAFT_1234633 [Mycena rebaudengoi]